MVDHWTGNGEHYRFWHGMLKEFLNELAELKGQGNPIEKHSVLVDVQYLAERQAMRRHCAASSLNVI